MKKLIQCFYIVSVLFLSGCATIISGTTQKVNVSTTPSDAIAKVDNNLSAHTPTVFVMERKNNHTMEISKEGYKTTTVLFKRTFNGMATGNILIGGIIGTGVDAVSGANSKVIPERVDLILEPGEGYADAPKFSAQKDQDFYDKSILKPEKDRMEKEKQKKEKEVLEVKRTEDTALSSPATGPKTNFSPAGAR